MRVSHASNAVMNLKPATLVALLQERAQRQSEQRAYTFLADGETEELHLTYHDLERQARAIGTQLHGLGALGERALLLYPPGLDYIAAFFGCLYAGAVAVPVYPPDPTRLNRTLPRLQAIVADAQATLVLTTTPILSMAELLFAQAPELGALRWIATDALNNELVQAWQAPALNSDSLAFLQYTSGSTAAPRGVRLTHGNLLHNSALIATCFGLTPHSRGVVWLPPYHDMGLIGGILQPLYGGFPVVLLSPLDFMKRPLRWLQALSRYQATASGGPGFAYDLCVRKSTLEERATLDLSHWELAFNGAEPVRYETLERFAEAFAPCGFRKEAFYPCYGLAEATLIVSGGVKGTLPALRTLDASALRHNRIERAADSRVDEQTLVSCGRNLAGQRLLIVDPKTRRACDTDQVGEIWVAGPSVAQGYWNQPEQTAETFDAHLADSGEGPFLRTGDLGFVDEGELFVTGRLKDLIIIRGRNHYPQDIEWTVERSHPAVRPGCCAAFAVLIDGEERLGVVLEVGSQAGDVKAVISAVRQAVAEAHELQAYVVVLLPAGSLPKTSSGKVQRHACRAAFLSGSLEVVAQSVLDEKPIAPSSEASSITPQADFIRKAMATLNEPAAREALITLYVQEQAARLLRLSPSQVDPQQPLSALGLDSLMAIELEHEMETGLGVALSMLDLLEGSSITQLAARLQAEWASPSHTSSTIHAVNQVTTTSLLLSHGQRALWFLHQLAPQSASYHIATAVKIEGKLDIPALHSAFQALVDRHPSLRTTFALENDEPVKRVQERADVSFQVEDAAAWSEIELSERLTEAAHAPFDLVHGPLLRVFVFGCAPDAHVLLVVVHHIIADFWSLAVLARELEATYRGNAGIPASLTRQRTDYAHWQADMLAGPEGERLWAYWQGQLAGDLPALNLPTDYPRPPVQTDRGATQSLSLSAELTHSLKALGQTHQATLYTTLLAAFQVLLYRYTGQDDILVGSPTAGRSRAELAGLINYLVNPVVLRTRLNGEWSFNQFLTHMRTTVLAALAHQAYPFDLLVERLQPKRDPSRSPLFQVMFSMQQSPWSDQPELAAFALGEAGARLQLGEWCVESVALEQRTAQFDLTLRVAECAGRLVLSMQYNRDLFTPATIERMLAQFEVLLRGIVAQPEQCLSALPLLTETERRRLLVEWNDTRVDYPRDQCVHRLFEAQVEREPNAIAVVFEDRRLTYHELNAQANQLAHHLQRLGAGPGTLIGICLERSLEMLIGVLGVLKAGAAYVPLDPAYPQTRLAFMLDDASIPLLLTQARLLDILSKHRAHVVCLDSDWPAIAQSARPSLAAERNAVANVGNLPSPVSYDNLAYVIYTSGSTGQPKGVQIPHRAVVNFLSAMRDQPGLTRDDSLLSVTTLSFDIAGLELFLPLSVGARVILVSRDVAVDGTRLAEELARHEATAMQATPAAWRLLLEAGWQGSPNLKILCGGEALPRELANQLVERGASVWNLYGPTETTIWSAASRVEAEAGPVALGRPIANTQIYILDAQLNPTPINVPGELHIGGDGLAWGYLHRPDLTAEKFIPNPFTPLMPPPSSTGGDTEGGRLYRTGDLARWRADGTLEFLGRLDYQVKVRGYRIELSEIESALRQHPAVQECVVVARETSGDKRLVAYLAPRAEQPSFNELRAWLRAKLPEHMLPAAFVMLDALPLTPNGKVDRKALPVPEAVTQPEAAFAPPRNELERSIAQVWREVLGLEQVGLHDNFFDLGGHSLLVARVHRRLREVLPRELTLVELFQYPTIDALARYLSPAQDKQPTPQLSSARARQRREEIAQAETGIAVIGLAGRFPGARNLDAFWQNLCAGVEAISFFSDEEVQAAGVDAEMLRHPQYVKAGGLLDEVEWFDATFFGYTPREAELLDPQHRLFLEYAWEALERAGYDAARYIGRIGVYASAGLNAYLLHNLQSQRDVMQSAGGYQTFISNDKDFVSTRVSYKLNLRGPSVTVQTACSSSLVAIHLACQSLLNGECEMALAGGVSLNLPQKAGYLYQERGIASPDGHCRAFDAQAGGTVRGSGVGAVVLKRLADAIANGDSIAAVIKGTAINNDGALKVGYTAPSVDGQAEVIGEALAVAGVEPESITYVEAHGTGTEMGDPIEVAALRQAFGSDGAKGYCGLGSVKSNIGHLDTAAGVAGFIKTVLALQHGQLPPSLHFQSPNPQIDFASSPFYVNARLAEWLRGQTPRRAGVSSFGIGGTNAHVVLEEAPAVEPSSASRAWQLLVLSAKTKTALDTATANLVEYLSANAQLDLADVAYTLQVGRAIFPHQRMLVCRDRADALTALETLDAGRVFTDTHELKERPVVFMFTGQGAQYVGMGRELYQTEPAFQEHLDRCADLLQPHLGLDLRDALYPAEDRAEASAQQLNQTWLTQPALFAIEYALAQLWLSWGVRPQAMLGHSIGEYVAACLAGVFSLEDALALVAARGRLMQSLPGGAMLAVALPQQEVLPLLDKTLSLAAVNAPAACVVSGPMEAVDKLERRLTRQDVTCRRLQTSHAFHSEMMAPILEPFAEEVRRVRLNAPQLPYLSNVTGTWVTATEAMNPDYWARHLRQTVRFDEGLGELLKDPERVLLEVGPGRTLSTLAMRHPGKAAEHIVLSSLRPAHDPQPDLAFLLTTLGKLWLAGVKVDWAGFYAHERRHRLPLPTYPFERQRYWIEAQSRSDGAQRAAKDSASRKPDIADWFYAPSWKRADLPQRQGAKHAPAHWLVFVDECGLGREVVKRLQHEGHTVTVVRAGPTFTQLGDQEYALNPREEVDYDALLQKLRTHNQSLEAIVHLWNVTSNDDVAPALASVEPEQDLGFYSLLYLAQALGKQNLSEDIQIAVFSNELQEVTGDEQVRPEKATLLGPVHIIPHEYANIRCRSIDVIFPQSEAEHAQKLVAALWVELTTDSPEPVVAYRGHHRWVQTFEPVRLEKPDDTAPRLKEGGVYLITGGLGGIGLTLAKHLAGTAQAKLILTSRSVIPDPNEWEQWLATHEPHDAASRKIRHVQELETLGAEVLVVQADVADQEQMQSVVTQALNRFGRIDGAIHAAGIPGGGLIQLKTREMAEQVMAAKVKGTLVLFDALKDTPLEFFVLCSSINSIVGRLGQVDYAAANAFLDACVHASSQPVVCINWETWREVGMAAETVKEMIGAPPASESQPRPVDHPLLDVCIFEGEEQSAYLTHFRVDRHWELHEHGVMGKPTLPGTTYLEMARAAFAARVGEGAVEIREAHFLTPLRVEEGQEKPVRTVLKKQGDAFAFSVMSQAGDTWHDHAQGIIAALQAEAPAQERLRDIQNRCREQEIARPLEQTRLGSFDLKRRGIERGASRLGEPLVVDSIVITEGDAPARSMEFGPRWHSLKQVQLGAQEGLALFDVPETIQADFQLYQLHPALLDFATSFLRLFKSQGSYLPLSYKRLRMWRPLPARIYSHVRFADGNQPQDKILRFDVTLLDEQGRTLIEIDEFAVMRIDDIGKLEALPRSSAMPLALSGNGHTPSGAQARVRLLQEDLQNGLSSAEGVVVFERILASGLRRVIVSTRDLSVRNEQSRTRSAALLSESTESTEASKPRHPRPPLLNAYAAPRNETEQKLAEIWQEALGIESVGVHDNFFELGGDSLLITRIHVKFVERFKQSISIARLLQYPTIADLAQFLSEHVEAAQPSFEAVHDRTSKQKAALKQRQQKIMKKKHST